MTGAGESPILERYRANARALGARFDGLSSAALYEPVADYLPSQSSLILDVGAGSGRDAAWLAGQGHRVVAVEPVAELKRGAVGADVAGAVEWVEDTLPALVALRGREGTFDLILLSGVWHHVADALRPQAFARLAALLGRRGRVILSLRHGAGEDGELIFACDADRTIAEARAAGLAAVHRVAAPSLQPGNAAAGMTWTWLALEREEGADGR